MSTFCFAGLKLLRCPVQRENKDTASLFHTAFDSSVHVTLYERESWSDETAASEHVMFNSWPQNQTNRRAMTNRPPCISFSGLGLVSNDGIFDSRGRNIPAKSRKAYRDAIHQEIDIIPSRHPALPWRGTEIWSGCIPERFHPSCSFLPDSLPRNLTCFTSLNFYNMIFASVHPLKLSKNLLIT